MKQRGFSLIELLVVISIIGILIAATVVAISGARENSRDAKRIADLKQIELALKVYRDINGSYPGNSPGFETAVLQTMNSVPVDPLDGTSGFRYIYNDNENCGDSYTVLYAETMEKEANKNVAGTPCAGDISADAYLIILRKNN